MEASRHICRSSNDSSLEAARLVFECLLQGGDEFAAFFDGRFDHALVYAVSDGLIDGVREVVLSLHDAQGRPNDRVAHVPLPEIALGVLDHEVEAFLFSALSSSSIPVTFSIDPSGRRKQPSPSIALS